MIVGVGIGLRNDHIGLVHAFRHRGEGRTWIRQCQRLPARPFLHLQERQRPGERDQTRLVYSRVDNTHLACLIPKRVLLVLPLQVVYPVHALLIQHHQPLVSRPAKSYDFPLVPLCNARVLSITRKVKMGGSIHTEEQEAFTGWGVDLYLRLRERRCGMT